MNSICSVQSRETRSKARRYKLQHEHFVTHRYTTNRCLTARAFGGNQAQCKFKTKEERKTLCKETTKDTALSSYRAKKGEHGSAHISLNPLRYTERTFTYIKRSAQNQRKVDNHQTIDKKREKTRQRSGGSAAFACSWRI